MNLVSNFSSPHPFFPQIHANTPTQIYLHRQINTEIYKHIHGQTNKEREISVDVGRLWIGGSELVVEIEVCGSTEMGLDAYELVLVVEISACGSTKSVFVGFDSCGACGGDWYLWWISDLTMRGK